MNWALLIQLHAVLLFLAVLLFGLTRFLIWLMASRR